MDRVEALKSAIVDLLPQVAAWNRRNFPESGHAHKAYGVVEETGELFHGVLKGLQKIRHTPEEIKAMIVDALADVGVYTLAFAADLAPRGEPAELTAKKVARDAAARLARILAMVPARAEENEPLSPEESARIAAAVPTISSAMVQESMRLYIEGATLTPHGHADSMLVALERVARDGYGLDFPTLLRETWAKVVAKRDWRADPMNAAEVAG